MWDEKVEGYLSIFKVWCNNIKFGRVIKVKYANEFLIEVLPWIRKENNLIEGGKKYMEERRFQMLG